MKPSDIESIPLFAGLTKKDRKHLAGYFREVTYRAGRDIVTQGSETGAVFVVTSGTVKVIVNGRTLRRLGVGSPFGEMSILVKGPRSATVQAETDVTVLRMTSVSFLEVARENWSIAKAVMTMLATRLIDLERQI